MAINLSKFMTEDEQNQKGQTRPFQKGLDQTRKNDKKSKRGKMIKFKNSHLKKKLEKV